MVICPECEAAIDLEEDDVEEGQTLDCPECDARLEVVNTNPVELDVISDNEADGDGEGSW
jgi:alpha-aminoadipate carrier protein LysW